MEYLYLNSMTFTEFLVANGDDDLALYLSQITPLDQVPESCFHLLCEKLKMYFVTVGMPESVLLWTRDWDVDAMQTALFHIIEACERDSIRHANEKDYAKISMIWDSAPAQLAPTAFGEGNRLFTEFRCALSENNVLEALSTQMEGESCYWSQNNPPYEVDFVVQRGNDILPMEVSAEGSAERKSLRKFREKFGERTTFRVRFSLNNLSLEEGLLNITLFLADQADHLIGIALERL